MGKSILVSFITLLLSGCLATPGMVGALLPTAGLVAMQHSRSVERARQAQAPVGDLQPNQYRPPEPAPEPEPPTAEELRRTEEAKARLDLYYRERLLKASAGISVGESARDVVNRYGMECYEKVCGRSVAWRNWVGVTQEISIGRENGKVKAVIVSYAAGDPLMLLELLVLKYGASPDRKTAQVGPMTMATYDWPEQASMILYGGTDARGRPLRKKYSLFIYESL